MGGVSVAQITGTLPQGERLTRIGCQTKQNRKETMKCVTQEAIAA